MRAFGPTWLSVGTFLPFLPSNDPGIPSDTTGKQKWS